VKLDDFDPVHVVAGPVETVALASETALAGLLGRFLYRERVDS